MPSEYMDDVPPAWRKQVRVESYERELKALMARYEGERQTIIDRHDGDFNDAVQAAIRILNGEERTERALLALEWGLA